MASSLYPTILPGYFTSSNETLINLNGYLCPSVLSTDLTKRSQLLSDHKGLTSISWNAKTPVHVCSKF